MGRGELDHIVSIDGSVLCTDRSGRLETIWFFLVLLVGWNGDRPIPFPPSPWSRIMGNPSTSIRTSAKANGTRGWSGDLLFRFSSQCFWSAHDSNFSLSASAGYDHERYTDTARRRGKRIPMSQRPGGETNTYVSWIVSPQSSIHPCIVSHLAWTKSFPASEREKQTCISSTLHGQYGHSNMLPYSFPLISVQVESSLRSSAPPHTNTRLKERASWDAISSIWIIRWEWDREPKAR